MKNLAWSIVLILFVSALCLWAVYPLDQKIHLGKDLQGGTSLIYLVNIPEGAGDRQAILTQTIEILKDRVNPKGVLDISMQPLGADRIEIVMPLPNEKVLALREQYKDEMSQLLRTATVKPADLDEALRANTAVERFGGDGTSERAKKIASLQEAYNKAQEAKRALDAASNVQGAERGTLEQAYADAQIEYEKQRDAVQRTSLDQARLVRVLNLSKVVPQSDDPKAPAITQSPREIALSDLKNEFPHLANGLDKTVAAFDLFQSKRTSLDDPEDLMRLLRGAGVLEFHIAVRNSDPKGVNVADMRQQLKDVGPEKTTSDVARWYRINELKQWYKEPEQRKALEADPENYFAARDLAAAARDGNFYLLLYTTKDKSMVHDADTQWTVVATGVSQDQLGRPAVSFRLDTAGGNFMSRLTGPNVHQPMAIVLDGQVYTAPNLNSAIGNSGIIEGDFARSELDYLTRVLAAGALGARLSEQPIAVNTLGPSVGQENLQRGLNACLFSIVVVGIFMICYYFFFGFVADVALALNGLCIFGIMAIQQASFTLPGLAGVALTIGMAVDANVLIYERIREEIQRGLDLRTAIRVGYQKAFSAIFDGHVTSILVSVALYLTATTEVKGFAITMIIGLTSSLFTSLFVTRTIFAIATDVFNVKHLSMLTLKVPVIQRMMHPEINWVGLRKYFITGSVIACTASIILVVLRGADMLDTEFRGGVSALMHTAKTDPDNPNSDRKWLPHTGPNGVETRLRNLGKGADPSTVPDPAATTDPVEKERRESERRHLAILQEISHAAVLTVGKTRPVNGVFEAQSFRVSVTNPKGISSGETIRDTIVATLVKEFEKDLEVNKPLRFDGAGSEDYEKFTYPITSPTLGDNLNQPQLKQAVPEFVGGVAVVINNIDPPIRESDVEGRIDRMRQQPDFSDAAGRTVRVIGVIPADSAKPGQNLYKSFIVLVGDTGSTPSASSAEAMASRFASREWKLISSALQQQSSLEQVSIFSSAVAETLSANAVVAITLSLLGILVYLWIRFGSIRYADGAIIALVHDVILCLGALALSQFISGTSVASALLIEGFRINLDVVAALLTITGYSVNDTIVILDRIRENRGKLPLATAEIVNASINQTLSRTFLTSGTVLMSVLVLFFVGGPGLRALSFCLLIGLLTGTYSTVAIAAPLVIRNEKAGAAKPNPQPKERELAVA